MTAVLTSREEDALAEFARTLVDQNRARVVVPPNKGEAGFWFGGGNMIEDPGGRLYLIGRYRNHGDSRSGLHLGERGLELAIFRSDDRGATFGKVVSWNKSELNVGDREVLSIEGSALHWTDGGVELFVSTEKSNVPYPRGLESFQKPGTGVWTIDRLRAETVEGLKEASPVTILSCDDPQFVHVKDPFVYDSNGDVTLLFCTHPFNWASSNTALAVRKASDAEFGKVDYTFFPRGFTWDVAIARGTCVLDVPKIGALADRDVSLIFYDGGESLRNLQEHASAVARPRGYSCEEVGGAACIVDGQWHNVQRLSKTLPWFISPHGTGCSRYVDVLPARDGYFVTWQQSQEDLSQPLVLNFVSHERVRAVFE